MLLKFRSRRWGLDVTGTAYKILEENANLEMGHLKDQLLFYTGNQVFIRTEIKYGFTETALDGLCRELNPFAVVLGLKNTSPDAKTFLGSTVLKVVLL